MYIVQRMCGHASTSTTLKHYGHLWDEVLDEAAEAIERHLESERKRAESAQARRRRIRRFGTFTWWDKHVYVRLLRAIAPSPTSKLFR